MVLQRVWLASLLLLLIQPGLSLAHGNQDHGDKKAAKHMADHGKAGVGKQHPWGQTGDPDKVDRKVEVSMSDAMRFSPDSLRVEKGETIHFVVRNEGKLMHEFVLGTAEALNEHAELMMKYPDMAHDEPYMAHVAPGASEDIIWRFNRSGEFGFACLIAGHYQAGMKGTLSVQGPAGPDEKMAPKKTGHSPGDARKSGHDMTEGQVRRINREKGTVMIEHGEIPNLNMPPMAMMFHVEDTDVLNSLKPGDTIRFKALHKDRKFIATDIQAP